MRHQGGGVLWLVKVERDAMVAAQTLHSVIVEMFFVMAVLLVIVMNSIVSY